MKYTIQEVLPAQIKVEFEDGSWALVPVSPDATKEQIDTAVSQYDPDFLPKPEDLVNKNIKVGDEGTSKQYDRLPTNETLITQNTQVTTPKIEQTINAQFGIVEIADYFASKGDNRLKDAIYYKLESYVSHENFSIDSLISNYQNIPVHYPIAPDIDPQLNSGWEDILKQAEEELNAEQS